MLPVWNVLRPLSLMQKTTPQNKVWLHFSPNFLPSCIMANSSLRQSSWASMACQSCNFTLSQQLRTAGPVMRRVLFLWKWSWVVFDTLVSCKGSLRLLSLDGCLSLTLKSDKSKFTSLLCLLLPWSLGGKLLNLVPEISSVKCGNLTVTSSRYLWRLNKISLSGI